MDVIPLYCEFLQKPKIYRVFIKKNFEIALEINYNVSDNFTSI